MTDYTPQKEHHLSKLHWISFVKSENKIILLSEIRNIYHNFYKALVFSGKN